MDVTLTAVIVHDIKNALSILEGKLHDMTAAPTREQAAQAYESCTVLRERLIGFLTLYKASSQGLTPNIEAVNPEDFLRSLIRDRASSNRPELRLAIVTQNIPLIGFFDENLTALVLEAALQNATRFARTAIEIGCEKDEGGGLVFTIRDDGPGLGSQESTPSTGLGMELCLAIAQAHRKGDLQGNVLLHNHAEGGAVFTLYLP
jgi:K+-sensing histidine kinase KdpD